MMMFYKGLLLTTIFLGSISCQRKETPGNTELEKQRGKLVQKIDSIGNRFLDTGQVKGISIAVCTKDDTLYNKGFGFVDSLGATPVDNDHIFLMASISKLVGATMVMKLVEEGRLELDATLLELLPDFPNREQAGKITLRQLLSHTSGLMDYAIAIDSVYLATRKNPSTSDYYRFFEGRDLFFEPGEFYSYSNSGFVLMAMIIERITGNGFEHEVDRIINSPSGLSLKLIAQNMDDPKLSSYFERADSTLVHRPHWPWIKGDGGLTTSAINLARFPFYWSDGTLISQESFDTMIEPITLVNGITTGYGLGVRTGFFEGERVVGHTGGHKSVYAMMMFFPERELSIAVMVNTDNTPADAVTIMGPVGLAVLDKEVPDLKTVALEGGDLRRYEGTYLLHEYKHSSFDTLLAYVDPDDQHLYMKFAGSTTKGTKYYPMGNHTFAYERYPMDRTIFTMDGEGRALAFRNYWNGLFQRMAFRDSLVTETP